MKTYADLIIESVTYRPLFRETPHYLDGRLVGFNEVATVDQAKRVLANAGVDFDYVHRSQSGSMVHFNHGSMNVAVFTPALGTISLFRRPDGYRQVSEMEAPADLEAWFAGSKCVDANGKPLVMYHGVPHDYAGFDKFDDANTQGHFFTSDPDYAVAYAEKPIHDSEEDDYGPIIPVYLRIKTPLMISEDDPEAMAAYTGHGHNIESLGSAGYDGMMIRYADGEVEAMVLNSSQIVSTISAKNALHK